MASTEPPGQGYGPAVTAPAPTGGPPPQAGTVVPLPGRGPTTEQTAVAGTGTALAVDDAIAGELLSDQPDGRAVDRRTVGPRSGPAAVPRAAGVVARVVAGPDTRTGRTVRLGLRTGLLVMQGAASWVARGWDAATMGVYRRQITAADAGGNQDLLAAWTERAEQAKHRRHERLLALPALVAGIGRAVVFGLVGLVILLLVVALLVQVSGAGTVGGVFGGVRTAIRWVFTAVAFVWTPLLCTVPAVVVVAAWREGRRRGTPPAWLTTSRGDTPVAGVVVTADAVVLALQHLGIAKMDQAFKKGWAPEFELTPTREGQGTFKGYRAIFDVPKGVTPTMVADRIDVLATNLHRIAVEVWPSDYGKERGGRAGFVNLYVADSGIMDKPTPEYPLAHTGTADVFIGVPMGITQRGDLVVFVLNGSNVVFGGQPGQGKSNAVRVLVAGAALDPLAEIRVHVFAGNGDFDAYSRRLSRYHKGATPEHAALATEHLHELLAEVERRELRLAELSAKKLTRQLATHHSDLRPLVVVFSECHELFGDGSCGEQAADLAIRVVKRGRKTGVTCVFDTQSARANAIPGELVENVGINGCFAVKTWRSNDGFLGDGSFAAGIRATELRFNIDRGTMVVTGVSEELFEILRTFYIEVDDDTGYDAADQIIDRAMDQLAPGTPVAGDRPTPAIATRRDLLDDLDEVLDVDPVPAGEVIGALRTLAPTWAPYKHLTVPKLVAALAAVGIKVPTTRNKYPIDPVTVREALARQATADLDDHDGDQVSPARPPPTPTSP